MIRVGMPSSAGERPSELLCPLIGGMQLMGQAKAEAYRPALLGPGMLGRGNTNERRWSAVICLLLEHPLMIQATSLNERTRPMTNVYSETGAGCSAWWLNMFVS